MRLSSFPSLSLTTVMYLFTCWVVLSLAKPKPQSLRSKCRVAANPISGNSQAPSSFPAYLESSERTDRRTGEERKREAWGRGEAAG